LIAIHWNHFQ